VDADFRRGESRVAESRALLAHEQHARPRKHEGLQRHGAIDVVEPDEGQPLRRGPDHQRGHVVVVVHVQVAVGHHRPAPVPAVRSHDVHGCDVHGVRRAHDRPDVGVVAQVLHRDVQRDARAVEVGHDRLDAPVAVAVDHVAPVALGEQLGVEAIIGRPRLRVRTDPHLGGTGPAFSPGVRVLVVARRGHAREPRVDGMPLVASVLEPALDSLSAWAVYGVVWGFVFVESGLLVGFLLPGDSILFGAGLIAGTPGSEVNLALLATGAFIAAVAGDQVGFVMGRRLGRPYLDRRARPSWEKHIRRTEEFYDRFGPLAVVSRGSSPGCAPSPPSSPAWPA
jgi:membrane protein YqaA with SNARE-associated domain